MTDLLEAIATFNRIVDQVETRCMAVDGPVTPTLKEMQENELAALWRAVQAIRAATAGGGEPTEAPFVVVDQDGICMVPEGPAQAAVKAAFDSQEPIIVNGRELRKAIKLYLAAPVAPDAREGAIEEAAKVAESMERVIPMWDRPGGPPGNGPERPGTPAEIARAIRALHKSPADA